MPLSALFVLASLLVHHAAPAPRFALVEVSGGANVRRTPHGALLGKLPGETPLGTTTWLWAVGTSPDGRSAHVLLPWAPNGRTGWIRLAGRRIVHTPVWVRVDRSAHRLWLMRGPRRLAGWSVTVGAPVSPTPTGRFSVTDPISTGDPTGPFGSFAFGLTGHQPHLPPGWTGGDQLAIHGTNEPWLLGRAASAGCVRVSARALAVLERWLRPGTPVVVQP